MSFKNAIRMAIVNGMADFHGMIHTKEFNDGSMVVIWFVETGNFYAATIFNNGQIVGTSKLFCRKVKEAILA